MLRALASRFQAASDSYARHYGIDRDADWYVLKMLEESGEVAKAWNKLTHRGRRRDAMPEALEQDLADELADLLGMVLLVARQKDVDLNAAIARKWYFDPEAPAAPAAQGGKVE